MQKPTELRYEGTIMAFFSPRYLLMEHPYRDRKWPCKMVLWPPRSTGGVVVRAAARGVAGGLHRAAGEAQGRGAPRSPRRVNRRSQRVCQPASQPANQPTRRRAPGWRPSSAAAAWSRWAPTAGGPRSRAAAACRCRRQGLSFPSKIVQPLVVLGKNRPITGSLVISLFPQ
jgi:hypothetical protein